MNTKLKAVIILLVVPFNSYAIIILPLPNLGFPPVISKTRDALEKSTDTKALATVGEDKTFGSRQWTFGTASGKMTQADADSQALRKCEKNLAYLKTQLAGSQPIYNFGNNKCELYKFENVTLNLPDPAVTANPNQTSGQSNIESTSNSSQSNTLRPEPPTATGLNSGTKTQEVRNSDTVQRMKDLDTLFKQNLINQSEYEQKKKQIIDSM